MTSSLSSEDDENASATKNKKGAPKPNLNDIPEEAHQELTTAEVNVAADDISSEDTIPYIDESAQRTDATATGSDRYSRGALVSAHAQRARDTSRDITDSDINVEIKDGSQDTSVVQRKGHHL